MQDSNLQMSFWKMPFEMSGGFRLIPTHLGTRDFRAFPEKMEAFLPPIVPFGSHQWPTLITLG